MKESDYKNPKWQKKRLEIMQSKGFKCEWCESIDKELHTHHIIYEKGKRIWEYEDTNFMLLCKDCHESFHEYLNLVSSSLSLLNKSSRDKLLDYILKLVDEQ